ncbi:methylenetetrahydrofolate reductase (NADPH) isoform X2 [Amyelois transitella]|nr:methylenetetrahydrofolate reductase (NADPH) isoform X2 [Amyelois transitella]
MAKITDLINNSNQFSFSFEVTPELSEGDVDNLEIEPLFYSVTWHAKGHQNKDLDIGPLRMARKLSKKGKTVLLHMSCDMLRKEFLDKVLMMLQEQGIRNLFLILGEKYNPSASDFPSTMELIKYIKEHTGDWFCIAVAGDLDCSEEKLQDLKKKTDAGANFIITQAFFEPTLYKTFRKRCTTIGINVPIMPGIFYFETTKQLSNFVNLCKIKLSDELIRKVENDPQQEDFGVRLIKDLIDDLNGEFPHHFHFFTLNKLERVQSFIVQNFVK